MRNRSIVLAAGVMICLVLSGPIQAADQPGQSPHVPSEAAKMPDGVIGISLHIGADRVGEPAALYVGRVHREGPAHKAGLRHGDEVVSVDGIAVSGKTYEQVVKMVRGEAGTSVKLGVKREGEGTPLDISVTRIAGDKLMKSPGEHGTYKDKPQPQP